MENVTLQVSDAIALINQTLEYAYPTLVVEGEVSSFKVNKNQYVFFDIKDAGGSLGCFMTVYQLRIPLEDGMRVQIVAQPKLTPWGKFSLTVRDVRPVGEGSLKRAFELLKKKLDTEGLFAPERKRPLPLIPQRIGVISSTEAAGYADFIKILNDRWRGIDVTVANTQVQGAGAAAQIVRAIEYFNTHAKPVDVLVIVRGGGSADDLSVFNDEPLVRAIAGSRIPTMVGVGHEVDVTLADMVADKRAATPSNAAQLLVPDRLQVLQSVEQSSSRMIRAMERTVQRVREGVQASLTEMRTAIDSAYERDERLYSQLHAVLLQLDPRRALARGYAIVRGADGHVIRDKPPKTGEIITIQTKQHIIEAGVKHVKQR